MDGLEQLEHHSGEQFLYQRDETRQVKISDAYTEYRYRDKIN